MQPPTPDELPHRRRLSIGHYVGLQVFAIVLPPAVFLLCSRSDRPRNRDLKRNLILLPLLWVPAVVHASLFLNDGYRVGNNQEPKYFEAKRMPTAPAPQGVAHGKSTASEPYLTEGSKRDSDEMSNATVIRRTREASRPSVHTAGLDSTRNHLTDSTAPSPTLSVLSTLPSIPAVISPAISYATEARASTRYRGHQSGCHQCQKCSKCYMDHVRHFEERRKHKSAANPVLRTGDHSREKHLKERHHVPRCLCQACQGKGVTRGSGGGMHEYGCVCDVCQRPKMAKVPRERYRWPGDPGDGGVRGRMPAGWVFPAADA